MYIKIEKLRNGYERCVNRTLYRDNCSEGSESLIKGTTWQLAYASGCEAFHTCTTMFSENTASNSRNTQTPLANQAELITQASSKISNYKSHNWAILLFFTNQRLIKGVVWHWSYFGIKLHHGKYEQERKAQIGCASLRTYLLSLEIITALQYRKPVVREDIS